MGETSKIQSKIFETSDMSGEAMVDRSSYDPHELRSRMKASDDWNVLIQGHLYLDHVVSRTMRDALPNPKALGLGRIGFAQRLEMVVALGFLDENLATCASKINSIRNRLAHTLDFKVKNKEIDELFNILPEVVCELNLRQPDHKRTQRADLGELLENLITTMEISRQFADRRRKIEERVWEASRNWGETLIAHSALDAGGHDEH